MANSGNDSVPGSTVSVIDTATNNVITTVHVGNMPRGIAVNQDGTKVYVTNIGDNTVYVIDTSTNTTEVSNSDSHSYKEKVSSSKSSKAKLSGSKAKASLSKHKHKNHSKHHKTGKKSLGIKVVTATTTLDSGFRLIKILKQNIVKCI